MFTNEDYERLLVKYTAEGLPAGESIQHFCDRKKVPYNLFNKWYRDTRHQIVKVSVDGVSPEDDSIMDSIMEESSLKIKKAEKGEKKKAGAYVEKTAQAETLIMIDLRTTQGLQIRRRGMTYSQFMEFAKNLVALC